MKVSSNLVINVINNLTWKGHVKKHIQSQHKGIKYPCNHCKYQATQPELHVEKISNKKQLEGIFESYPQRTLY